MRGYLSQFSKWFRKSLKVNLIINFLLVLLFIFLIFKLFQTSKQPKRSGYIPLVSTPTRQPAEADADVNQENGTYTGKSAYAPYGTFLLKPGKECRTVKATGSQIPGHSRFISCNLGKNNILLYPESEGHSATVIKRDSLRLGPYLWFRTVFDEGNLTGETYGTSINQQYYTIEISYSDHTEEAVKYIQNIILTFQPL